MGVNNSMDVLASLQALAARKSTAAERGSAASNAGQESFADVWAQVKKEQQEWKETLDAVDLAQYKLSLADSFWSDRTKANKYLRNYVQRQQRHAGLDQCKRMEGYGLHETKEEDVSLDAVTQKRTALHQARPVIRLQHVETPCEFPFQIGHVGIGISELPAGGRGSIDLLSHRPKRAFNA